jgi:4-amino-4-deoxy-L-arabinose transferase-like glycosyltransferase
MNRGVRPLGSPRFAAPVKASRSALTLVLLAVVVAAYVVIGSLYAALTPTWQVPDEPAHYNYIRSLAEGRGFPILEPRDYDQEYLRRLTSEGFPPELSVEPLEYEDHQPPLYYLLATPIYLAFAGALLPLRLLSVVFGAAILIVAFGAIQSIFPKRPRLGLMTAAFIAFIPQHVAMTAGVNNDALAELVVGGTLWALLVYLDESEAQPWPIGLLLGTALLTKTTAYVVVGVAAGAIFLRWRREAKTLGWAVQQLAWMLIPAMLLSAPWFVRNGMTYGWGDPLGLARHNAVVEAQPRSSEWLAMYGWWGLLSRLARTTFHSFWGQFGWMAVPLPSRIYRILLLLSILLAAGFAIWLVRRFRASSANPPSHQSGSRTPSHCLLLALSTGLTFSAFVWYNVTFVQHQGRYLFPALIPLATAAALGLETLADVVPRQLRPFALIACFAGLAAFDTYCLFRIILPNL